MGPGAKVGLQRLRGFRKLEDIAEFLGEAPVLSKFGLVVKTKASGISGVVSKLERILLPRTLDVAQNVLRLQAHRPGDG